MQGFFSVNIGSVYGCLLCDKNQFFYAFFCHLFRLFYQTFHRNTSEFTTKFRNDAVSTVFVTALCNLKISEMSACCQHSFSKLLRKIIDIFKFLEMLSFHCFVDCFKDISVRSSSKYCIYFRYFLNNLVFIALCHTACYDKNLTASGFLVFCHLKNGIDTFFFCVINKAAGINHNRLCFCFIIYDLKPVAGKKSQHFL